MYLYKDIKFKSTEHDISTVHKMLKNNDFSSFQTLRCLIYQSPLILTELFQNNLMNISYLTACYLYQVMMTLHFLNDVANGAESTQK